MKTRNSGQRRTRTLVEQDGSEGVMAGVFAAVFGRVNEGTGRFLKELRRASVRHGYPRTGRLTDRCIAWPQDRGILGEKPQAEPHHHIVGRSADLIALPLVPSWPGSR